MPVGFCKLCLQTKDLRDSHYLPKRLYAYFRAERMRNPNPVVLLRGELKQISDQLRGHVFCHDCEVKLNNGGEKWVLANIPHGYGYPFPLHNALEPLEPIGFGPGINVHDLRRAAGFDLAKMIYFGISVFWRGAVHEWKSSTGIPAPNVSLGGNEEALRQFVFGTGPVPKQVVLTLDIWPYTKVPPMAFPPQAARLGPCSQYWFYITGLLYALYFGEIPTSVRDRDLRNGIAVLERAAADSVWQFAKESVESMYKGPKFTAMLQEIAAIRSDETSK